MSRYWPFNKYPGTDCETFNWEWILKTVKFWSNMMEKVEQDIESFMQSGFKDDVEDILAAHPEWTTTVQDGAITAEKINAAFLKTIVNVWTTPEEYGAVGDGITDDTTAFQEALDSGKPIMGKAGHVYKVSTLSANSAIIVNCSFVSDSTDAIAPIIDITENSKVIIIGCEFTSVNDQRIDNTYGAEYGTGYTSNRYGIYASYGCDTLTVTDTAFENMFIDVMVQGTVTQKTKKVIIDACTSTGSYTGVDVSYCSDIVITGSQYVQNRNAANLSHAVYIGYNDNDLSGKRTVTRISDCVFDIVTKGCVHCFHGTNYDTYVSDCDITSTTNAPLISYGTDDVMKITSCIIRCRGVLCDIGKQNKYEFTDCNIDTTGYLVSQSDMVGSATFKACTIKCRQITGTGKVSIDGSFINITVENETLTAGTYVELNNNRIYYRSTNENPWRFQGNCTMVNNYCKNSNVTQFTGFASGTGNVIAGNVFDNCKASFYGYSSFTDDNVLVNIPA